MSIPEIRIPTRDKIQTRRAHNKSRNGCLECKRRRVKCDENHPSCDRCVLKLYKCVYPPAQLSASKGQRDKLSLPSPPYSIASSSQSAPSFLERSSSYEPLACSPPTFLEGNCYIDESHSSEAPLDDSNTLDSALQVSDTDLYHHYLQHTSRTLTHNRHDQETMQIGLPTLALKSKTVFHALLAVSAACMCCDMIAKETNPNANTVNQILMAGYRHYNLASERMRELISQSDKLRPEPLLASAVLLVPFAAASQQVNHWISSRTELLEQNKFLSTTPRDVIVVMRGINATLKALNDGDVAPSLNLHEEPELPTDISSSMLELDVNPGLPAPSRTHVMYPILSTTSQGAFLQLQQRLKSASLYLKTPYGQKSNASLSACVAAFEILSNIRSNAFPISDLSPISTPENSCEPNVALLPQLSPWLGSYAARSPTPLATEPLTRYFLTFLVQAPQEYIDLVLPLLDQRLESPMGSPRDDISANLTTEQALALDIYAHWSVLMFLVEEESWWIGKLPVVTMTGMMNRYGEDFMNAQWLEGDGQGQWWPGSMLNILKEIKRCQ